ncbi:hypothetical protein [Polluticoccus soli]|uniref:hypothetical protein n=1 Tax=Polluticoccus soli TaxID=3034150 RepID=UPI0023E1311D|nr:hypothetical protein [Flavipsychrobacter sp. JY13-12]
MKKCRPIPAIALIGMLTFASCTRPALTCHCTISDHGSVTTTKTEYKKSRTKVEQKCEEEKKFHQEQYLDQPGVSVECKVD